MAVYYSFHYRRDSWRVQQVVQMGVIEGQPILKAQQWEEVKRKGEAAIKKWIDDNMKNKTALVVLVGAETASRPWVLYEIAKAWDGYKPLVGIRIHGLANQEGKTDPAGANPFTKVGLQGGGDLGQRIPLYDPTGSTSQQVYASIKANLATWVDSAVKRS